MLEVVVFVVGTVAEDVVRLGVGRCPSRDIFLSLSARFDSFLWGFSTLNDFFVSEER